LTRAWDEGGSWIWHFGFVSAERREIWEDLSQTLYFRWMDEGPELRGRKKERKGKVEKRKRFMRLKVSKSVSRKTKFDHSFVDLSSNLGPRPKFRL
jgi:hypothetical protein